MKMKSVCTTLLGISFLSFCSVACKSDESARALYTNAETDYTLTMGHEALTHFALKIANAKLSNQFFPFDETILPATASQNPFVRGNYAVDWGKPRYKSEPIVFPQHWSHYQKFSPSSANVQGKPEKMRNWDYGDDWNAEPTLYPLHFLRVHIKDGVFSKGNDACQAAKNSILFATANALKAFATNKAEAQMWMGSALHTIQDSYSEEHTVRSISGRASVPADPWENASFPEAGSKESVQLSEPAIESAAKIAAASGDISDVCAYGKVVVTEACQHDMSKSRTITGKNHDSIWIDAVSENHVFENIRDLPRASIYASFVYLRATYAQALSGAKTPDLAYLFENYFRCNIKN